MSDGELPKIIITSTSTNQNPDTTTDTSPGMDKVNTAVLKTTIDGIPLLTSENYSIWRIQVVNFLDLIDLYEVISSKDGDKKLLPEENKLVKLVLVAKLDSSVQTNVINASNQLDAKLIWKSITNFFASNQTSNKAWVFQSFLWAQYTPGDITGFITSMKSFQAGLMEVGWEFPADGLGHLVLDKFPENMNNIADMITHSGKDLTIDTVIDHL
jgi:hypothetical protein